LRGPLFPVDRAGASGADEHFIVCEVCRSQLPNAVDLVEWNESRRWILLRCGEVRLVAEVSITQEAAERRERDRRSKRGLAGVRSFRFRAARRRRQSQLLAQLQERGWRGSLIVEPWPSHGRTGGRKEAPAPPATASQRLYAPTRCLPPSIP
jgi:hypothetical protein